jgi:adenylosuccinate lyase
MEFWGDKALPLLDAFADRLSLGVPDLPWITARDRVAEFASLLAMVTATLAKIGGEVYELQRPEIGELREPARPGVVGSITMPHKRNPEVTEHLVTLSRLVRAQAGVMLEGMVQEHERDGRGWKAEWAAFPEACLLTGASLSMAVGVVEGLAVDAARMRVNLEAGGGYAASEQLLAALARRLGKHKAERVLHRYMRAATGRGQTLEELLEQDSDLRAAAPPGLLRGPDLGCAPAMVDAVIAHARQVRAEEAEEWP